MALTIPSGLHAPITNKPSSETVTNEPNYSPGNNGAGDVVPVTAGSTSESVERPIQLETAMISENFPDFSGLRDIGIASFGERPILEVVIGTDERVQIKETTKFPWRAIASLLITGADNSQWIGTGWFIGPRTLATAGHCVYIKGSQVPGRDGWVKKIQVIPARNGNEMPLGVKTGTQFWTVKGWGENGLENCDYAAIILDSEFDQKPGYFAFGVYDDNILQNATANVAGYPGDKPTGTLWYDSRKTSRVTSEKIYYEADTYGGQSGTVVYMLKGNERIGIAVHAYGDSSANSGTRISLPVFSNLKAWQEIGMSSI